MSDNESPAEEKLFCVDRAKQGRAACKKCKQKCLTGDLRIAKLVASPYGSGKMKTWYHVDCIFEQFLKQRPTTKRIESQDDLDGWDALNNDDKDNILGKIEECDKIFEEKYGGNKTPKKPKTTSPKTKKSPTKTLIESPLDLTPDNKNNASNVSTTTNNIPKKKDTHKDCLFREFRRLVADISNINSYLDKTDCVRKVFTRGSDGVSFKGDIKLWCRLLLPGDVKRTYNIQSKQIIKLFSRLFGADQNDMLVHLEEGDIGETIHYFFERSSHVKPASKSLLTLQEVDSFLEELTKLTKEEEQLNHFKSFVPKCTPNDLKIVVRLIKGDLRMNARAKHVLDGVHPDAYAAFQASRDINAVIKRCLGTSGNTTNSNSIEATITLMTPVLPMLAEACKSVEQAMKKCPNGMYSEIKYDGERVQVHKKGGEFKYFSRSLKPVMPHKVAHFKDYIPKAFPQGTDLILDSEILLIDTQNGKPLPFGSLGVHKKTEFKDATVCLFVFDCIYYNGQILTHKPISYRKKILKENMTEIPNHIVFSEMKEIHKPDDLKVMIVKVLKLGLEGLVLKDLCSIYEPGKRHWLKVKKDYLFDGAMADSADLIVLGAWYGTGKKGGMMSVFLMGCYDNDSNKFCTVTKVHTGHDDKTLEKLQEELEMVKISGDQTKVPDWLKCTRSMVPDFVAVDPKKQPVWEITGAEFTQHDVHTADGISIRFPRVTKIRDDKDWHTATSLKELKALVKKSKENTDVSVLMKISNNTNEEVNNKINVSTEKKSPKRKHQEDTKVEEIKKPKLEETVTNNLVTSIQKPLPDYFKGVRLMVDEDMIEIHKELLRHFIAFGGILLSPLDWRAATHILHLQDTVSQPCALASTNAKHIIVEWIRDSIIKKSLQDFKPYSVRWKPSLRKTFQTDES